ncbi:hypothetical protein BD779DRAFT_1454138, partial [Infundibulicybe gibba]
TYYGKVLHFVVLNLPPSCPFIQASPSYIAGQPLSVVLAAITPIKPTSHNELGMPSYTELGPIEVVDASTIKCVVGRVKDRDTWTIIERHPVTQAFNDSELEATGNPIRGESE